MEQVVLVEYVEAFMPYFYAAYVLAIFQTRNVALFLAFKDWSHDDMTQAVRRVLVFGTMELASLLLLFALVKWHLGINVFYVLPFVLEAHARSIHGKMFFYLICVLNFNAIHFGADFSFQFDWLQRS